MQIRIEGSLGEEAGAVLAALQNNGHSAYLVGGCVRDALLDRPIADIDIATSALPAEVMRVFPRTAPTGIKHGTVTVIMNEHTFEVTTFRKESAYEKFRRPAKVEFISELREDLLRRDFTMNAIALDRNGRLIDPFGGQADIRKRIVRCVGEADARFQEDALRMMRCLRFAATYGFAIAKETWAALLRHRDKLRFIAVERIRAELEKMIEGPDPFRAIELLRRSRLMEHTGIKLPQSAAASLARDAKRGKGNGCASRIRSLQLPAAFANDPALRWAALLACCGTDADAARELLRTLTFAGSKTARITAALQFDARLRAGIAQAESRPVAAPEMRRIWLYAALEFGQSAAEDWLALREAEAPYADQADSVAGGNMLGELRAAAANGRRWLNEMGAANVGELDVRGQDLLALFERPPGPWLGRLLDSLLKKVAVESLQNEKEALLNEAKRVINDHE